MKKIVVLLCLFVFLSCKQNVSEAFINYAVIQDYSDLFSEIEKQNLSEKIIDFEKLTTNQICVYTIDSIPNNEAILYHATNLANKIGVGLKEKDNGILILISKLDRQVAIATGTSTEKLITDSIAKVIIAETMIPEFKNGLYFEGVTVGLDSIFKKWQTD